MARRPPTFRQRDLTRALKAAKAAGIPVRIVIESGRMIVIPCEVEPVVDTATDLDKWKAKHARHA